MAKRNVPISSLLDPSSDENSSYMSAPETPVKVLHEVTSSNLASTYVQSYQQSPPKPVLPTPSARQPMSLHNLVSRFQTSIKVLDPSHANWKDTVIGVDGPIAGQSKSVSPEAPVLSVSEHIKRYQTSLIIKPSKGNTSGKNSAATSSGKSGPGSGKPNATGSTGKSAGSASSKKNNNAASTGAPVIKIEPPKPLSKTSINSIINIDEEPESVSKKRPSPKKKDDVKKRKVEDGTPGMSITTAISNASKKKKSVEPTIVAPETAVPAPISLAMTTDKSSKIVSVSSLPRPTVINLLNPQSDDEKEPTPDVGEKDNSEQTKKEQQDTKDQERKEQEKAKDIVKEKVEVPIIALNIPLVDPKDPKPGQSEVVINVLRLSEEKYGWSVIHPQAKSAIDVMDDMIDDEDDDEGDEDDVAFVEEDRQISGTSGVTGVSYGAASAAAAVAAAAALPVKKKELTEEQLVRQHEAKMNRKVGKYDFEDPFIDDIELQMQEEIISTKEGFFVYWGPLVDDRNLNSSTSNKKGSSKTKR